ncbi:hypothetical protein [Sphingomonas sp. ID0503]|uniref:hypothetical protein n=1 Tax=Sphingomonas sp. ID0503 TaxID=3399691 RepID=UPI003AFAA4FF
MTKHSPNLAADLMQSAVCHTDNMPDAVSALLTAAGEIMNKTLGEAQAIATLRSIVDQVEAAHVARFGRQPGEAVQ